MGGGEGQCIGLKAMAQQLVGARVKEGRCNENTVEWRRKEVERARSAA
jgi:hypothetical protein